MSKKYDYKIFPQTAKARLLLLAAFIGGLLAVGGYVAFVFLSNSWFDDIEVTYANQTDTTVAVYLANDLELTLRAGEERTISYYKLEWWFSRNVEARTLDGRLVFATKLDRDDLKRQHYRVVIDGP